MQKLYWTRELFSWIERGWSGGQAAPGRLVLEQLEDRNLLSAGSLDLSFNGTGLQNIALNPGTGNSSEARAVALQSDGKIVLAGYVQSTSSNRDMAVARLNPNGSLDTTFGSNGQMVIPFNGSGNTHDDEGTGLAIQADGKIVVGGFAQSGPGNVDFAVARLNPNGSFDLTFQSNISLAGRRLIAFDLGGNNDDEAKTLTLQPDGKILIAGFAQITGANVDFAVARLNQDGSLDGNFQSNIGKPGQRTIAFDVGGNLADEANGIAVRPDGKIILTGTAKVSLTDLDFAVASLNPDGSLDTSFVSYIGKPGRQVFSFNLGGNNDDEATAVVIQPNNAIVLSGFAQTGATNYDFAAARLNPDGSLDPTFQSNVGLIGRRTVAFDQGGSNDDRANAVTLQPDGKIILAGFATVSTGLRDLAAARLNPDGSLDSTFQGTIGRPGQVVVPVRITGNNDAIAEGVALQPNRRIVLAGAAQMSNTESDFVAARLIGVQPTDTVGVFDPGTGTWYLRNSNSSGPPVSTFAFGAPGWVPVAGDWNADGTTTIGVVDPTTMTWYLRNENSGGNPDVVTPFQFGLPGWIPVVGDWNATGHTGIGVFDPTTGTWYLRNAAGPGGPDAGQFVYGAPGWLPVAGDWRADGKTTLGVVNPANMTWYLINTNVQGTQPFAVFPYGIPGWVPVAGDWLGTGHAGVGAFDPASGTWYLNNNAGPGSPSIPPFAYGAPGWKPVAGDWSFPAHALLAEGGEASGSGTQVLTDAQLQQTVQAALDRLRAAGADGTLLARLASVQYLVSAAVPAGTLGLAYAGNNEVLISPNAAGWGWFVDSTPLRNEEFRVGAAGSPLVALPGSAAAGRMDLLTTVLHEMGHMAGLGEQDHLSHPGDVMADTLAPGVRRTDVLDILFAR